MKRFQWQQLLIGVSTASLYVAAPVLPAALLRGQTFSGFGMLEAGALAFIFGLPPTLAWLRSCSICLGMRAAAREN